MGVDGFDPMEVVFDIELSFGVKLPSRDARVVSTTGQLYAYLVQKLEAESRLREDDKAAVSLAAKVFYRLRRELVEQLGIDRASVRLSRRLEEILPLPERRQAWTSLGQALGLSLPPLRRPPPLTRALWTAALLRLLGGILLLWVLFGLDGPGLLFGSMLGSALFAWWAFRVTRRFAVQFAPDCQTIGSSVHTFVRWNYRKLIPEYRRSWSRTEVWHDLHVILGAQLGVSPDEVPIDATFRDLMAV